NASFTPAQVETFLFSSCTDLGSAGDDAVYGHGRVNAAGAVALATGQEPPPSPISPANASYLSTTTPVFDWSDVTDPSGVNYRLQVDDAGDFSTPIIDVSNLTVSSYRPSVAMTANQIYWWRVRAVGGSGKVSAWTSASTFTIDRTPPATPLPSAP